MVRINILNPKSLSDQHLIAEYDEILMLLGYVRKYPKKENIPENYTLGKGHIRFFKDKLIYLKERYELIKKEMKKRGFRAEVTFEITEFDLTLRNGWLPGKEDREIIKKRIIEKIKMKPDYYRYYRKKADSAFLIDLIKKAE